MPKVTDYMHRDVVMADGSTTCRRLVQLMLERNVGSVIIVDAEGKPRGIITEKDILRVVGNRMDPDGTEAGTLMSENLVKVTETDSLDDAARTMLEKKVRHLVVVSLDGKKMAGVLSAGDLLTELMHLRWL